mmetsp:Transcript_8253/g.12643  ORF Transcript_8253/g.12643 Transcript_8253/m.12643 type:complete len:87 (-) Transcript_8253:7017-7277(-)
MVPDSNPLILYLGGYSKSKPLFSTDTGTYSDKNAFILRHVIYPVQASRNSGDEAESNEITHFRIFRDNGDIRNVFSLIYHEKSDGS